jgi:hypothetical protein
VDDSFPADRQFASIYGGVDIEGYGGVSGSADPVGNEHFLFMGLLVSQIEGYYASGGVGEGGIGTLSEDEYRDCSGGRHRKGEEYESEAD